MDALATNATPVLIAFHADIVEAKEPSAFECFSSVESLADFDDDSVDHIVVHDFLEYLSDAQAFSFILNCYKKLKPGRHIDLSVPDFDDVIGALRDFGLSNPLDAERPIRSWWNLKKAQKLLGDCGLYQLTRIDQGVAVRGAKPSQMAHEGFKGVRAVLSAPRFGPIMHWQHSAASLASLNIRYQIATGAYWHQVLSQAMESLIDQCEVLIVCDYDSIFTAGAIEELLRLMSVYTEVDAIAPMQARRNVTEILGVSEHQVLHHELAGDLIEMKSAHFGATCFRTSALKKMPKPWFLGAPNQAGEWGKGRIDADIYFWKTWGKVGNRVCIAPHVGVGHLVEAVVWIGQDLQPIFQLPSDMRENGPPPNTFGYERLKKG